MGKNIEKGFHSSPTTILLQMSVDCNHATCKFAKSRHFYLFRHSRAGGNLGDWGHLPFRLDSRLRGNDEKKTCRSRGTAISKPLSIAVQPLLLCGLADETATVKLGDQLSLLVGQSHLAGDQ